MGQIGTKRRNIIVAVLHSKETHNKMLTLVITRNVSSPHLAVKGKTKLKASPSLQRNKEFRKVYWNNDEQIKY